MANIKKLMAIRSRNRAKSQSSDFEKKVIRDGNNTFRLIDSEPHITFEHWFTAADGKPVHSFCSRDYEAENDVDNEDDPKYCVICDLVKDAWELWNDQGEYSEEEIYQAGVIIGKEKDKNKGFAASWGAKQFAYINVIDRDDDWCVKNTHTKVLSKSSNQSGISAGDGGQLDELIDLVEEYGDWEVFDTRMKKQGKKLNTEYRVYKGDEFDLTDEEKSYEKYNFATLIQPTKQDVLTRWLEVGVRGKSDDKAEAKVEEKVEEKVEAKKAPEKTKLTITKKTSTKKAAKKKSLSIKKKEPIIEDTIVDEPVAPEPIIEDPIVDEPVAPEPVIEDPIDDVELADCPECNSMIPVSSDSCPQCGAEFE